MAVLACEGRRRLFQVLLQLLVRLEFRDVDAVDGRFPRPARCSSSSSISRM